MSNSNVQKLQTIFPDADQSLIRDVLQQCRNNGTILSFYML